MADAAAVCCLPCPDAAVTYVDQMERLGHFQAWLTPLLTDNLEDQKPNP
jgi:hypothetical protein